MLMLSTQFLIHRALPYLPNAHARRSPASACSAREPPWTLALASEGHPRGCRRFPPDGYSGLTATLRNLITPAPCCSVNGPSANRPLWSSAVFSPLRTTLICRPLAVIS